VVSPGDRAAQAALLVGCGALFWLTMQVVHELGHVLAAVASGGTVVQVVLHPLMISRTDVQPNPSPAVVVWAGPLVGIVVPGLAWGIARAMRSAVEYLLRCWCGFCLIANGAYIGAGAVLPAGDAQTMLRTGSPTWLLLLFGALTVPAGLWCWHNQGRHFGVGPKAQPVNRRHTLGVVGLLVAVVVAELVLL
jgi:hypothetical protein